MAIIKNPITSDLKFKISHIITTQKDICHQLVQFLRNLCFFAHFVCFCAFCVFFCCRAYLGMSVHFSIANLPHIYCELHWYELHNSLLQIKIFSTVYRKCLRPPLYDIYCKFPSYFFANSHSPIMSILWVLNDLLWIAVVLLIFLCHFLQMSVFWFAHLRIIYSNFQQYALQFSHSLFCKSHHFNYCEFPHSLLWVTLLCMYYEFLYHFCYCECLYSVVYFTHHHFQHYVLRREGKVT